MYNCDLQNDRFEWTHRKRKPKDSSREWRRISSRQAKYERLFSQVRTIESNIGFELSLVPEVECVTVRRQEDGKGLRVLTIINDKSPEIRSKIYKREQAIIDAYPMFEFDFHIMSRMGRSLDDLIRGTGEVVFQKR